MNEGPKGGRSMLIVNVSADGTNRTKPAIGIIAMSRTHPNPKTIRESRASPLDIPAKIATARRSNMPIEITIATKNVLNSLFPINDWCKSGPHSTMPLIDMCSHRHL